MKIGKKFIFIILYKINYPNMRTLKIRKKLISRFFIYMNSKFNKKNRNNILWK
jgi:hypothetical protein